MIKVVKFGGSSVASAEQFKKVKEIVSDKDRKYIVVSACGKETHEDYKVTDLLYLCEAHANYNVSYDDLLDKVKDKYLRIKDELKLSIDLDKEFEVIETALKKKNASTDYLVSRGEYLTALCMAEYLDADFADAKDIIIFKYDGSVDMAATSENLKKIKSDKKVVIPGFYGALPNGTIKVMKRGGSDITGSIIANCIDADVYENWTDVNGIRVADPHIIDDPMRIPYINYSELRGLSYMGANVLHDDATFAVREKNIPIHIMNTNNPNNDGTVIMEDCTEIDNKQKPHTVTGITGRKNYTVITVIKNHSSTEIGFLKQLVSIFEKYRISIESVPSTVDTFSVIVQSKLIEECLYEVVGTIKEEIKPEEIIVEDKVALIAVVGRAMKSAPGMSGKLLSEFGRNEINIKVISQSADELSIVVGVENKDFEKAIKCIYERFIKEEEK